MGEVLTQTFSVVAMVSMAFGILGLAACLCCKDVDYKMTSKVSASYDTSVSTILGMRRMLIKLTFRSRYTWRTQIFRTETNITRPSEARIDPKWHLMLDSLSALR